MQDTVEKCTRALAEAIRTSEAYQAFENSKTQIKKHPQLREMMDEFRRDRYLWQNGEERTDPMGEIRLLLQRKQELCKNPLTAEYLLAEEQLCRMLQKITMEILSLTDVEIEAFEDQISI